MKWLYSFFTCLLFLCISVLFVYAQDEDESETETEAEAEIYKRNIFADAGYASLGVITSNVFLNLNARLGAQSYAQVTFKSMWENITHNDWIWEAGDRFLVNQFGHPYQGSTYFASARINGFNFYESLVFAPLGSLMWEVLLEPTPSINDVITTTIGGVALGEMVHRLFLEADSPSVWATIGGFLISPLSGFNKIYNRKPREFGGGNIHALSVRTGVEKAFLFFQGHQEQADSWKYPGGHINVDVVYGNPFIQESKTPYEHFELYAGFTTNTYSYHAALVSDGYLFSFNPVQTDKAFTSTGLNMHLDFFNATNDLIDNLGYGNIQFSSSAIGWAVKHQYRFSPNSYVETKAHAAVVLWGNSMYNGEFVTDDYWVPLGDNLCAYGMGENVKLFFTLFHNRAGKLDLVAHGYHIISIPVTKKHSTGYVFFVFGSLDYCFPLGKRIGVGAKGNFWGLFGRYEKAESVNRYLASSCLYVRFAF